MRRHILTLRLVTSIGLVTSLIVGVAPLASAQVIGGDQLAQRGRQANLGPGAKAVPVVWAETWILVDITNGTVLAAKNAHDQRAPASTLKALTGLTLLPDLALDQTYVARAKDVGTEGAHAGLNVGQQYTIDQLLYGMFLHSGNDAAVALAHAAGGVKKTVARMNEVAASLQARDTVAKTPSGLDRPGQVSSAYDLALIARAGLARPDFAGYVSTKKYDFPGKRSGTFPMYNQNRLLMSGYKGAIGVKTGFTTNAGRTFIGAATRKGVTLLFVGMGIHEASASAARKALTWGFKNRDNITPIGTMAEPLAATPALAGAITSTRSIPSDTAVNKELASAGLAVPTSGDQMAPWWFWALILAALAGLCAGWLAARRRRLHRHPRSRHAAPESARRYRPYQPR
jgi:D-alanyl-D-alanine carboxypeptidase (penicillin-binding protein 5/6)